MQSVLEFHDSTLRSIARDGDAIVLRFDPARVHRSEGDPTRDAASIFLQPVVLRVEAATIRGAQPRLPAAVWDGELRTGAGVHEGTVAFPSAHVGAIELRLEIAGRFVEVFGARVAFEAAGDAVWVEELSSAR
jgi:hypothetical protein